MMLDDRVQAALYSDATMRLGELHGAILESSHIMRRKRFAAREEGIATRTEFTEFGKKVGVDEIHWWVFEKEPDLDELQGRTEEVLVAAQSQSLKEI